jgi:hypothetical protein
MSAYDFPTLPMLLVHGLFPPLSLVFPAQPIHELPFSVTHPSSSHLKYHLPLLSPFFVWSTSSFPEHLGQVLSLSGGVGSSDTLFF